MKAGQSGGVTAASLGARKPNPRYDKNITWLGSLYLAQDYALASELKKMDPVILKVAVEASEVNFRSERAGWYTRLLIPPCRICFQSAEGDQWESIAAYNGNAYVFRNLDEQITDQDPAAAELGYVSEEGDDEIWRWKHKMAPEA